MRYIIPVIVLCILSINFSCNSAKFIALDKTNIELVNRAYASTEHPNTVSISPAEGGGLAIIKSVVFATGTINFDVRGEYNPGKSFVGFAFNVQDGDTYEAIYFRPFNFQSDNAERRSHSIQYVYEPDYPWSRLREEQTDVFEAEYPSPPNPDDWFLVQLDITSDKVIVREPTSKKVLLEVNRIGDIKTSKIGFWTGHNSRGDFRNLKIKEQ